MSRNCMVQNTFPFTYLGLCQCFTYKHNLIPFIFKRSVKVSKRLKAALKYEREIDTSSFFEVK